MSDNNAGTSAFSDIIHNCGDDMGESIDCDGEYDLSSASAAACPLYETQVTTTGIVVDYFDITPYGGPYSFTIQDGDGNQMDFVVWPVSSSYQDGFDITATDLNVLTGIYHCDFETLIDSCFLRNPLRESQ